MKKYHERYGILYTQRLRVGRKLVCIDMKFGRIISFHQDEINGEEIEDGLRDFVMSNLERLNTGYWDYSGDPQPKVFSMIENLQEEKKSKLH
jgi:hypothetical protein